MGNRFDTRSKERFMKDVLFGTQVEKLCFDMFLDSTTSKQNITIINPRDNGVDNTGQFVEDASKTAGADYMVDVHHYNEETGWLWEEDDVPLEVKFVPTYGKMTLKKGDLEQYRRERAAILFVYSSHRMDLKRPKDYDFERHSAKILKNKQHLRWGIMTPTNVERLIKHAKEKNLFQPIPYMGNKIGIIIPQKEFGKWFQEETF